MTDTIERSLDEHVREMDEQGYTVFPQLVDGAVVDDLRDALEAEFARLTADGAPFAGGGFLTGHLNCYPGIAAKAAYEQVMASPVPDLVGRLNPSWRSRPRVTLNYNMPGSVAQHYHMDGIYVRDFVIANVAVVDTDLVNGAIDVLPGTNREFSPYWKYAAKRAWLGTTRLPARRGDVLVRRSTLWHRGMPNLSTTARPMLAVTFGETAEENEDPFLLNDGEIEFYPNWFRPTRLGRLRERTFVAAPITYSTYRFTRSLWGNKGYDH